MESHAARTLTQVLRHLVLFTALGALLMTATAAHATPEEDRARAEKLIAEGLTLARSKQFREAIPKFEAALKLYPHPETMHNLARAHEELGELKKAYDYFTQALKSDYTFAADGRQRLMRIDAELRRSFARVTVRTTPSQATVVLHFPSSEEETHVTSPFQTWVPAGRTTIIGTHPSFRTGELDIDLAAGEDREVTVVLVPLPKQGFLQLSVNIPGANINLSGKPIGKSPLESTAYDVGAYELEVKLKGYETHREQIVIEQDAVTSVNVSLVEIGHGSGSGGVAPWVGWSLVGAGVVAGGVALYLQYGKARPTQKDADAAPDADYERLHQKALDFQTAAAITGIIGGVAAGVGVYLLIFEAPSDRAAGTPSFTPNVAVTPDGGLVGGTLRF